MTLSDTENLATAYCPSCAPEHDPLTEILTVKWCLTHQPSDEGSEDGRVSVSRDVLSAAGEVEAATNRPWCEFLHRAVDNQRRDRLEGNIPRKGVVTTR